MLQRCSFGLGSLWWGTEVKKEIVYVGGGVGEGVFTALKFENYELCVFYEILISIKTKNINVCCFLVFWQKQNDIHSF